MSIVIPFKRPKASEKHRGKNLCREGFHRWAVDKSTRFDLIKGQLVTIDRCTRCGCTRNRLS